MKVRENDSRTSAMFTDNSNFSGDVTKVRTPPFQCTHSQILVLFLAECRLPSLARVTVLIVVVVVIVCDGTAVCGFRLWYGFVWKRR